MLYDKEKKYTGQHFLWKNCIQVSSPLQLSPCSHQSAVRLPFLLFPQSLVPHATFVPLLRGFCGTCFLLFRPFLPLASCAANLVLLFSAMKTSSKGLGPGSGRKTQQTPCYSSDSPELFQLSSASFLKSQPYFYP